jgi:prophage antirepressor-like protein
VNARQLNYPDYSSQELRIMDTPETEWISTKEAADILDMELSSVSRLCRDEKLTCRQFGEKQRSVWLVDKTSVIEYRDKDKPVGGRPRKQDSKNL